ncbi:family 20 glycosylhydrolase [Fluviispira multicolorata]|uniref:beta-N-acetylhexosaminidase n=1 Tax=Fluviispira multicolorata TaxID=2654512 RepID=A0A833JDG9_9BACT|nr:family 20 glycosylhydrolase [Fluviispira multicolorata]KAB8028476.1 family 20 glycosylhydrolase [Fluviispira multicolorata]
MRFLNIYKIVFIAIFFFTTKFISANTLSAKEENAEHMMSLMDFVEIPDFNYSNKNRINETLNIDSIFIGACHDKESPCHDDAQVNEFYTIIKLTNLGSLIQNWKFGFYMPRSFDKLGMVNSKLSMNICNATNQCKKLVYAKETLLHRKDQSAGYTTILEPESNFDLKPGSQYEIRLIRNNQWPPKNYSAVPQNLFLVVKETKSEKIYTLSTKKSSYHFQGYERSSIEKSINEHNIKKWNSSMQSVSNNIIVPSPVSYIQQKNIKDFFFKDEIQLQNKFKNLNPWIEDYFKEILKSDLNVNIIKSNLKRIKTGIIIKEIFNKKDINNNPEGYRISITNEKIIIEAMHDAGVFYAIQSLRQLWFNSSYKNNIAGINSAVILDYPRFQYRGVTLDLARHYFSIDEIKNTIEIMSAHKINNLHLHLADDEAFRLKLSSFPWLNKIAGERGYGKIIGPLMFLQGNLDKTNYNNVIYPMAFSIYQNVLSKEEIREIIEFANDHQITVIPEIEFPGHARALIKAMPNVFYDKNDKSQFLSVQGYSDNVIPVCAYGDQSEYGMNFTYTVNAILREIAEIFSQQKTLYFLPNEVSIGGDEVSSNAWDKSSSCQGEWGGVNALEKSHKFFKEVSKQLPEIKFSGWQQFIQNEDEFLGNEIVEANNVGRIWVWNTAQNAIKQSVNLIDNKYPVVIAFADQTYFDLAYTPDKNEVGFTWATSFSDTESSLQSALSSKIIMDRAINPDRVLGIEGTLWSENLPTFAHLIYMALPKMAGLAEASWAHETITTQDNTKVNWQSLAQRLSCGEKGFLYYISKIYNIHYRGFPNGIMLETPKNFCQDFLLQN